MIKRILGWVIFALVAVFIGFLVWLFFFKTEPKLQTYTPPNRDDSFFPIDLQNNTNRPGGLNPDGTPIQGQNQTSIPRVRQLSQSPTAGAVAFERPTGSSETYISDEGVEQSRAFTITTFRYIERATGHLYEARENSLTQTRLSNTTIPKVHNAKFTPNGEHVLLQYIAQDEETVETLSAKIVAKSTTSPESFQLVADGYALEGVYLPQNIVSADISPTSIAYVLRNSNAAGSTVVFSDLRDQAKRIAHESPFAEWIVQLANVNVATLTTKADSRVSGFAYLLPSAGAAPVKLVGDTTGLTTLINPDNSWVIYSLARGNELDTFAYSIKNNETKKLGIKTLPEKCVFSQTKENTVFCAATDQPERVTYPETWYQGLSTFSDNLWKIDLASETYDALLIDREEVPQSFDMTKLTVSPRDEFVLFINKKDLTLWSIDITKARGAQ